jgi:hypothetical protein
MRTPITNLGISTIGAANNNIAEFFGYNAMSSTTPVVRDVFDVLYKKEERDIRLSEGFRGRPAIGSAFMSQLDFKALRDSGYSGTYQTGLAYESYVQPWAKMLQEIDNTIINANIKILLCGSVFGGTGASGLPVIARLLDDFYKGIGGGSGARKNLTLGSLLILPYFNFAVADATAAQQPVYARSPEFALNTAAAMQYYESQMKEVCDVFYCVGDQNSTKVTFSDGGAKQKNKAHIVELYAGLAVRDFIYKDKPTSDKKIVFAERRTVGEIGWVDLPCEPPSINYALIASDFDKPDESVVRHALRAAVRFAFAWYNTFIPELENYSKGKLSSGQKKTVLVWASAFFDPNPRDRKSLDISNPSVEGSNAEIITEWCEDFSVWLNNLHESDTEEIKLFFMDRVTSQDETKINFNFGRLVQDDSRSEPEIKADTVSLVKVRLDPNDDDGISLDLIDARGYEGLAKFIYVICGS